MDNIEKIKILKNKISNFQVHIDILINDIVKYPEADIDGKPTRQQILIDFQAKQSALNDFLSTLD